MAERIRKLNPKTEIFFLSAKTGEGVEAWAGWLSDQVRRWQEET